MGSQDLKVGTTQSEVGATGSVSPRAADQVGEEWAWRARRYVSVAAKFWISVAFAAVWVSGAVWLSLPWLHDLSRYVSLSGAIVAVALVAYIPALLMAFMAMSLLLDRQPPLRVSHPTAGVTIIIAARDEQASIEETLRHAVQTDYDGPVTFVLADNGSTDATCVIAGLTAAVLGVELVIVHEPKPGKANALNHALRRVETPYVVTVDADTLLHEQALRRLVSRLESAPPDTVAVAGAVMIRNSRANLLTRMQEWDYFLGIAAVNACRASISPHLSPKVRSRCTEPTSCAGSVGGPTRSVKTSSSPGGSWKRATAY